MQRPMPENFLLTQSQIDRFQKVKMGRRYGVITAAAFFLLSVLTATLTMGWSGLTIGILIGFVSAFFLVMFGISLGDQIHALFYPTFERFLDYRSALDRFLSLEKLQFKQKWFDMSSYEFQNAIIRVLQSDGFLLQKIEPPIEKGIHFQGSKNDQHYYIQCRHVHETLEPSAVYEFVKMSPHSTNKGILISPAGFTSEVHEAAAANNISLWDFTTIQEKIKTAE